MRFLGPFWVGTNFGPYHVPDIKEQSADFLAILVKLLAIFFWKLTASPSNLARTQKSSITINKFLESWSLQQVSYSWTKTKGIFYHKRYFSKMGRADPYLRKKKQKNDFWPKIYGRYAILGT